MSDVYIFISDTSSSDKWKDLIPLIAPAVVIILFIIERFIAARLRKREVERNWYLKVLIEPSIDKISQFYKDANESHKASYDALRNAMGVTLHPAYLGMVTQEIGKFQILKRDFECEVVFPIQIRYPKVGELLTNILLDLEDKYSESFNTKDFSEDERQENKNQISTNRSIFLNVLYDPIKI